MMKSKQDGEIEDWGGGGGGGERGERGGSINNGSNDII